MSEPVSAGHAAIASDPLVHLSLVTSGPQRVMALRLALTRVITSKSVVLDAGCGSLGLLAIMAAKLGAAHVVAVDVAPLDFAATLAAENGVADRIDFVPGDLHDAALTASRFDVIVGMIYDNEIKRDQSQQELMCSLVTRFGHSGTIPIPDRVRYTVTGYDCPPADQATNKQAAEWNTYIDNAERHTGISLSAVRGLVDHAPPPFERAREKRSSRNPIGYFDRTCMTPLTRRELFTEINYRTADAGSRYPAHIALPVIRSGRLNVVVWQQDLIYDDILIRTSESMNRVTPEALVKAGDAATLSTDGSWHDGVPVDIDVCS